MDKVLEIRVEFASGDILKISDSPAQRVWEKIEQAVFEDECQVLPQDTK